MALIEKTVHVMKCDICGKESWPIGDPPYTPYGFNNIAMNGMLLNVCNGCRDKILHSIQDLKHKHEVG